MVHDPDADVRYEVAMALGTFRYTEAVNLLISLMSEAPRDDCVDSAAAMAIQWLGMPAVPPLLGLLEHDEPKIRALAADVLGFIGAEEAIEPVAALLQDPEEWVRSTAEEAIEDIRAGGGLRHLRSPG
jgi:HEAT repeat protein